VLVRGLFYELNPYRRMVACVIFSTDVAINATFAQSGSQSIADQQMI
jgi:hypothetical protein